MKTVLVDNQKAAVLKNNNGKVVFNSGFLLLADHYGFLPRACCSQRARIKGKVEWMVKYLKENFFIRYRRFRQTPEQRFTQEQGHLQLLPNTDFDSISFMSLGMAISTLFSGI